MRKPPRPPKPPRRTLDQVILTKRDHRYLSKKRTGRAALATVRLGGDILFLDPVLRRREIEEAAGVQRYHPRHRHSDYQGKHRKD